MAIILCLIFDHYFILFYDFIEGDFGGHMYISIYVAIILILLKLFFITNACSDSPDQIKLKQYLASINAQEANIPSATPVGVPGISATSKDSSHSIVGGTPREVKEGFCGDGIINGSTEDCDQGAIQNTACRDYGGLFGEVKCQAKSCLYDISDCITPAVDKKIGGRAEVCSCNCKNNSCNGGCTPTPATGQSTCHFTCTNDCPCNCQEIMHASVRQCEFDCACVVDAAGYPQCECSPTRCDVTTAINKNIASIISGGY